MAYVLIGTETSQFSAKARAHLRWKGVAFEERSATPEVYRDIIEPRIGYPVIPVLLTGEGGVVQDSSEIIDHVDAVTAGPSALPDTPVQKIVSRLLELYADEWLAIAGMHYRWSYNSDWIVSEFGRVAAPEASREEQARIGEVIATPEREAATRYGVSDDTQSGIEAHYEGFLADFSQHLRRHEFVLGGRPTLGDFALYGVLQAMLFRDPRSRSHMERLAPRVVGWIGRMETARAGAGELLANDGVPETLLPILKRQAGEQFADLADSARALGVWRVAQPTGARVKRSLGTHEFMIGGRWGQRGVFTLPLWRLQGIRDLYRGLDEAARARADALLDAVGARQLIDLPIPVRLARREFRLVIA